MNYCSSNKNRCRLFPFKHLLEPFTNRKAELVGNKAEQSWEKSRVKRRTKQRRFAKETKTKDSDAREKVERRKTCMGIFRWRISRIPRLNSDGRRRQAEKANIGYDNLEALGQYPDGHVGRTK